ncbi:MAG: zinc metallopeptidase [Clostridiales bacterium]|nr:zinc metallopeptidase [Clostridiales bacterium]
MIYYILALVVMVWSIIVQANLKSKAAKGSDITTRSGLTANQVVERMLSDHGISDITIEHKSGQLTDCYSPREGKIYLSDTTYGRSSITAIAVAAHECGHAIQDHEGMLIYRFRQTLAPVAGLCSRMAVWIVVAGVFITAMLPRIININPEIGYYVSIGGVIAYFVTFLFYLAMLPVERNASSRALKDIKENGWFSDGEMKLGRKILRAAGDTYAVSLASSAITLLRLILIAGGARSGRRR